MLRRANGDRRRWHRSLVGAFGLYVVRASPRSLGVARNRIAKLQLHAHTILCVLQSYSNMNRIVSSELTPRGHKGLMPGVTHILEGVRGAQSRALLRWNTFTEQRRSVH